MRIFRIIINTFWFYIILILSCLIMGLGSSSPLSQWFILELIIIIIIPLIINNGEIKEVQRGVKYFLRQAPVSVWILFSLLIFNSSILSLSLSFSIMYKLGLPPFHGWVFSLIRRIGLTELSILLTIQKIIPINLMMVYERLNFIFLSLGLTLFIYLLNINSIRSMKIILVYSSFRGTFWALVTTKINNFWLEYMVYYSIILLNFIFLCKKLRLVFLKDFFFIHTRSRWVIIFYLLSIGGVPPFLGFRLKLIILKFLISTASLGVWLILRFSFILLYFYIQIALPLLLIYPAGQNIKILNKLNVFWIAFWLLPFILINFLQ